MKNKIKVKTKIYLVNLGKFLEISSLNKININHAEMISRYLQIYREPEIFRDLLKDLLDFRYVINSAIKNMEIIYKEISKYEKNDVESLKEIILNIRLLNDKDYLAEKNKDRILDLITEYSKILEDKLKGAHDLKNLVYGGSTITLNILVYGFYKALGGKRGNEILKTATEKLLNNVKFINSVRIIGKKD
jgi:hypothetical protein